MKLVNNWQNAHKWLSMHCMALAITVQGAWDYIPDSLKVYIPPKFATALTIGLLILGIAGRLIDQGKNNAGTP